MNRNKNSKVVERPSCSRRNNRNGNKDKRRPKQTVETKQTEVDVYDPTSKYNKAAYYVKNETVMNNITQLSFQNFIGAKKIGKYAIPSAMYIYMNPSVGQTWQNAADALSHPSRAGINISAIKLFNKLSMKSGRNMQYAPQDIAMMIGAMSQLYSTMSFMRRLFAMRNLSQYYNRMFPKAMIENMGIDYDDFVAHYADYRDYLNSEIAIVNQLPMLLNCGYLEKSLTQFEYIFTDSESPLAQMYLYVPATTWILQEGTEQEGTRLVTVSFMLDKDTGDRRRLKVSDIITGIIRPMIEALVTSSTLNLVYADLLNLASKGENVKFFKFDYFDSGMQTEPFYNYEALVHIHNLTSLQVPNLTTDQNNRSVTAYNDVISDPNNNAVVYNPAFAFDSLQGANDVPHQHAIVDVPMANPSPDVVLEALRYKAIITNNSITVASKRYFTYAILPDWYAVSSYVYTDTTGITEGGSFFRTEIAGKEWITSMMSELSQFDWHPLITFYDKSNKSGFDNTEFILGDTNFSTVIGADYLSRVDDQIYIGLFEME